MADDVWRQWQAFARLFGQPGAPGSAFGFASPEARGFAPYIESAERFTAAARKCFEDAAQGSAPAAAEAVRVFGEFLREQSMDFFRLPWGADFGARAAHTTPQMPELPALGLTREHQLRWQRTAEAARRMGDAQRRLQLLWSDALREAAAAFIARHAPAQSTAVDTEFLRGLYDSWVDCAEEAYARTAHGDAFCSALAEYVNATSTWRKEVQASVEHVANWLDLPTRSELNTLTRRLKSLEEELAVLRAQHGSPPDGGPHKDRTPRTAGSKARTAGSKARTAARTTTRVKRARRAPRGPKS